MLKFADCNIAVGQPNAISGWRIYDSAQIACQAQRCGIQKGLAFCNAALDLHPLDGNAEMRLICRREPFYLPVWMVMPNHTGEFWNVDELERRMRLADVRAVRLAPKYNVLGYSLRDWCSGELLDMLERTGTLALMDADQSDWETVHAVCCEHPGLKLVITNLYYRHARYIFPLLRQHPRLYLETSGLKSFCLLQTLCEKVGAEKLLFGSNLGTFSPGSAVCLVSYACISENEKEAIAARNLEALLERKLVD